MTTVTGDAVRVRRVQPDASDDWYHAAREQSCSHLAHSPEWAAVIREAYGHVPLYLAADDTHGGTGLLPAVIVERPLVGAVVTSMPFLDGGGPCSSSPAVSDVLVQHLVHEARSIGASAVELRSAHRLAIAAAPLEHKVNMVLPLPASTDTLWRQLDRGVRNQVRKAERAGLSVEFGGIEKVDAFYEIFAARMHDLGSPVHAPRFFHATVAAFGNRARVALVRKDRTPVGGLIALAFKDTLAVPWASCAREHFALCPNMLLYWETIRTGCLEGFARFDFGRSTRGSGTHHFKHQWGALEQPLYWYTIPIGCSRVARGESRAAACLTGLWQRLPLTVTRRVGPRVRKYLVQ